MFRDTKPHVRVSLHLFCSLGILIGLRPSIVKYTLTELYKSLSYETLSGSKNQSFDSVSDLIGELSFSYNKVLSQRLKRKAEDKKSIREIEKTRNVVEKTFEFSEEVIDALLKNYYKI